MAYEGVVRGIVITGSSSVKTVKHLPQYYTEVPPVNSAVKGSTVPTTSVASLQRGCFAKHIENDYTL